MKKLHSWMKVILIIAFILAAIGVPQGKFWTNGFSIEGRSFGFAKYTLYRQDWYVSLHIDFTLSIGEPPMM